MKQRMYQFGWIATASVAVLLLGGCAPEPVDSAAAPSPDTTAESPGETPAAEPAAEPEHTGPREQAEDCGWSDPALDSAALPDIPTGQDGELADVIVGAWQHTHFDTGGGYETFDGKDIRYIFPSTERILYCQHVPNITDHAENSAPITWDGTRIVLPGSAPGYIVSEWNDTTMVWINRLDDSRYLLQRR